MRKTGSVYLIIAAITLGLILVLEYNKPKNINWFPSFVCTHKIPYGTYVWTHLMETLFPQRIKEVQIPPYDFLKNSAAEGTYVFLNNQVEFGETELNSLLNWTTKGNMLFIASESFEKKLLDTLNLKTASLYGHKNLVHNFYHQLVNPILKTDKAYEFSKDSYTPYFNKIDTLNTTIIGVVNNDSLNSELPKKYADAIVHPFGKGKIVLSTFPKAFTNYFILKDDNKAYTAGLLSYLDASKTIYLDNHYKSGKSFYTSPMYIFLNNKALKWAYYMALIGVLLYVVFEGKRKQRAVPVMLPLKNQTMAFTRTIADMYYEKSEHKSIAEHKIASFLEHIRSRFHLKTIELNADFHRSLAARSNHNPEEIKELFSFMEALHNKSKINDLELKKLNTAIEKFKAKVDGKH